MVYLYIILFIGFESLTRAVLPFIWSSLCLLTHSVNSNQSILLIIHSVYLFFLFSLYLIFAKKTVAFARSEKKIIGTKKNKDNKINVFYFYFYLILIYLILIFNLDSIALFMEKGSDSIMFLTDSNKKIKIWMLYGIIGMLSFIIISCFFMLKKQLEKINLLLMLPIFLVAGKKSAVLSFVSKISVLGFIKYPDSKVTIKIINYIAVAANFSLLAGYYIYTKTINQEFSLLDSYINAFDIIYSSKTSYLNQIILLNGYGYAEMYSIMLGKYSYIVYYLNPFLKFIFGTGIEMAVGPFLSFYLHDNKNPNGVNPTIFFEYYFISNNIYFTLLSFLHMFLIFKIMFFCYKKIVSFFWTEKLYETAFFISALFLLNSSLYDTQNAIRQIPFMFIFIIPMITSIILQKK